MACVSGGDNIGDEMDEFDLYESQHYGLTRNKSQLDLFLKEQKFDHKQDLDILSYWKANKLRYPELALMAHDILSIPITTIVSESAFSIGSQIINKYRSSIISKNAAALLCTRDWLYEKISNKDKEDEELTEDFERPTGKSNLSISVYGFAVIIIYSESYMFIIEPDITVQLAIVDLKGIVDLEVALGAGYAKGHLWLKSTLSSVCIFLA
ncbi:hypothetical protein F0562_004156 [Nyssa sinensis]|uniref:HAT C-terminal dimerisation domain-containing protein n=1 Tax=Nyssa sinensis TaxID=561372 RepID=A0A5J5C1C4_9ASTE|nr:hypothetical protein F0562_004156 [Nyssa sinensis]